jgi:hemolysin activation/secretion protein
MKKLVNLFTCVSLGYLFCIASVEAASPPQPGAIREQSRQTQDYYELQNRMQQPVQEQGSTVVDETEAAKQAAPQSSKKIYVSSVVTDNSDILSDEEIKSVTINYEGKDISISDLFKMVDEINDLYKQKNYLSARAVLSPQKVEKGVIHITMIEGRVGDILVENNKNTNSEFITQRIQVDEGSLVKLDNLERELFYFNSINDVKIRAVLKPGEKFGTTDYILQAEEPEQYQTTLFIDNSGTEDTGRERIGVNFINNSLSGNRDVFSAGVNLTEGTQSVFVSYNMPVGIHGTRVGISADATDMEVIDGALEGLNITGDSYNYGLFVTHPLVVEQDSLINVFGGVNQKNSTSDFDGVTIFETDVGTVSVGVDTQGYAPGSTLYSRHVLTFSDSGFLNAEKSFSKYNLELSDVMVLNDNVMLMLRASAQLTSADLLPSSEQFQLGGMSTVRGYPSGLLSGDQGYFTSVEISFPFVDKNEQMAANPYLDKWRGFMFIDHGGAFPYKGDGHSTGSEDYITSVGIGLSMNLSREVSGRMVLADPLKPREDGEDDPMFHFYFSYLFH